MEFEWAPVVTQGDHSNSTQNRELSDHETRSTQIPLMSELSEIWVAVKPGPDLRYFLIFQISLVF